MGAEGTQADHHFDRRRSDANIAALRAVVGGLEDRVVALEENSVEAKRELVKNTELTRTAIATSQQVHQAVVGSEEEPGLKGRVDEIYAIFSTAKNGFRLAGKVGTGGMWVIDKSPRLFVIGAIGVAGWIYFKTGRLPDWIWKILA